MWFDVLGKFGFGYDDFCFYRDDIIVVLLLGCGYGGLELSYFGYVMVYQVVVGGVYILGYFDDYLMYSGGDVDLMNVVVFVFVFVVVLYYWEQMGEGQFIDFLQCDGVMLLFGEVLFEVEFGGVLFECNGNCYKVLVLYGVYCCWGVD